MTAWMGHSAWAIPGGTQKGPAWHPGDIEGLGFTQAGLGPFVQWGVLLLLWAVHPYWGTSRHTKVPVLGGFLAAWWLYGEGVPLPPAH